MKISIKSLMAAVLLICATSEAWSLDLPVKRVQGRDYYYYSVERGKTLSDVAKKLGITRKDIIDYNPGATDGIKPGVVLYFPVSEFSDAKNSKAALVKTTDGRTALRYKVQRDETLFGIAYNFGVTPDEIVELNPQANAGVKAGQYILVPTEEQIVENQVAENTVPPVEEPALVAVEKTEPTRQLRPVAPPTVFVPADTPESPVIEVSDEEIAVSEESDDQTAAEPTQVAVLLPLSLGGEASSKLSKSATEFARGFLMGINELKNSKMPVDFKIIDTWGTPDSITALNTRGELASAALIIAPEDPRSLKASIDAASAADALLLNLWNAADTSYIGNENIMQANIPAMLMYEKAAETLMAQFSDHIPVFLISKGGKGEKMPFTNYLREQYQSLGIEPIDLTYEGMLSAAELADFDRDGKFVFIPASGALSEFNKFARPLMAFRETFAAPENVALWGYPDWTLFRNDSLEMLHALQANIYSRFFCDTESFTYKAFADDFERAYGSEPLEQVPSQAAMGYDTARFIITNINANGGKFVADDDSHFTGLQTSFQFVSDADDPEPHKGTLNNSLYIVQFMPEGGVNVTIH